MHAWIKVLKISTEKLSFIDMHFILSYNYHPTAEPFLVWSSLAIDLNRRKNYICVHRTLIIDNYWFLHYNFQHMAECTLLNPCDRHSYNNVITHRYYSLIFCFISHDTKKRRKKTGCRICINLVTIKHLILFHSHFRMRKLSGVSFDSCVCVRFFVISHAFFSLFL